MMELIMQEYKIKKPKIRSCNKKTKNNYADIMSNNMNPLETMLGSENMDYDVITNDENMDCHLMENNENIPNKALREARKKGRNGDTILAHINPLEAMILKKLGGSGTINPETGLPEYGMFKRPKNFVKSVVRTGLPVAGAILGNTVTPGIGGMVGGSIGGGIGASATKKKGGFGLGALKGLAIGTALPSAASAAGSLTGNQTLIDYGANNAILPALGLAGSAIGSQGMVPTAQSNTQPNMLPAMMANNYDAYGAGDQSILLDGMINNGDKKTDNNFFNMLGDKSKNFLTEPANLLSLGILGAQIKSRQKPKREPTATEKGRMRKEEMISARLTPEELADQERYNLALEQANRRVEMNKFLPEEKIHVNPLYVKVSTPEEYQKTRQWLSYYDNPQFRKKPLNI